MQSLVSDIPAGDRKIGNLFYSVTRDTPQVNLSLLSSTKRLTQSLLYSLADLVSCVAECALATHHLHHLLVPFTQLRM
jgi:hypothetical protein